MPRICTACAHAERDALDLALVRGAPMRRIAAEYALSETAVRRHAAKHLPAALVTANEAREACRGERLVAEIVALQGKAVELVARAEAEGDVRAAVVALKEARECVELRARIGAELFAPASNPTSFRVEYWEPETLGDPARGARGELTRKLDALRQRLPAGDARPGEGASNP